MKRIKLLPSILLLVMCVGVLVIGIYAASPITHSIQGTISVSAGGPLVELQALLNGTEQENAISDIVKARSESVILNITDPNGIFKFDCTSVYNVDEVDSLLLYLSVKNTSNIDLGAYFVETPVLAGQETEISNISYNKLMYECDANGNVIGNEGLVKASFSGYTKISSKQTVFLPVELTLLELRDESFNVKLDLDLNIEEYNIYLQVEDNSIYFNTNGLNISATTEVKNAKDTYESATINQQNPSWNLNGLSFSEATFSVQGGGRTIYKLEPVVLVMSVTNNEDIPIKIELIELGTDAQTGIDLVLIGAPYIEPGGMGEISIQFASNVNRDENITAPPTISTFKFLAKVSTTEIISDQDLLSLVEYDENGMGGRGLFYYINLGTNPYYTQNSSIHNQFIRWYIYGKQGADGEFSTLQEGIDYDETINKFIGGGIYYFISEHTLSSIVFDNFVSYYATASTTKNIDEYISGITIKPNDHNNSMPELITDGDNINLYADYKLDTYKIFGMILKNNGFRLPSEEELIAGFSSDALRKAYSLSSGVLIDESVAYYTSNKELHGSYYPRPTIVTIDGSLPESIDASMADPNTEYGIRPVFKLPVPIGE